jgi:hypothetical protein
MRTRAPASRNDLVTLPLTPAVGRRGTISGEVVVP